MGGGADEDGPNDDDPPVAGLVDGNSLPDEHADAPVKASTAATSDESRATRPLRLPSEAMPKAGARDGSDDLFGAALHDCLARQAPLAARLRPQSLDDVVGQEHLVGPGKPLRSLSEADRLSSIILWGPPGTGRTTIARLVGGAWAQVSRLDEHRVAELVPEAPGPAKG